MGHTDAAVVGMAWASGAFNGGSWLGGVTNSCSYISVSPACPSNNGGRTDVLRYDTPAIGPASIAVSAGDDDYRDAKLTVAGSMGEAGYDFRIGYIAEYDKSMDAVPSSSTTYSAADFRKAYELKEGATDAQINAALAKKHKGRAFVWDPNTDRSAYTVNVDATPATTEASGDVLTTSAAVSFGQGTSIAASWSKNDMPAMPTQEHEYFFATVDHSYGDGSVGVYWKQGETSDSAAGKPGVEGTLWGIGMGHNIGGGATAYAGFRRIEEDNKEDVNLYLAGMRVTFN